MPTGKIKWFSSNKGFGFIEQDSDGADDVFLHHSEIPSAAGSALDEGTRVSFEIESTKKGLSARNVTVEGAAAPTPVAEHTETSTNATHFHNPYTFVPTPPRENAIKHGGFAGDFNPLECGRGLSHDTLHDDRWTGHIPIKLTTVTPLVLPKTDGKDHPPDKPYDVLDYIPESSLRGMLRSAYEVVTNSRYARFRHDDRLAYRMDTGEALKLIPAMIKSGMVYLFPGTSHVTNEGPSGTRENGATYAAMLSLYGSKKLQTECDTSYTPKTGDEVWAEIVLCQHEASPRNRNYWSNDFVFWKVVKVWPKSKHPMPPKQTGKTPWYSSRLPATPQRPQSYYAPLSPEDRRIVKGQVLITNENMGNKHDERIFFNPMSTSIPITPDLEDAWRMRIKSYREAHTEKDFFDRTGAINKPWKKIGDTTGQTAWSPHLYQDGKHQDRWGRMPHDALNLQEGDMVYARCEFKKGKIVGVLDLFPVMISRELYANSPANLLDSSLKPAKTICELSPADRLFGWVPQEGGDNAGYKSRIRVVCEDKAGSDTTIESFSDGALPLAILGQPKPAQGRFYVAKDTKGNPQNHISKEQAGYETSGAKHLRGRKQYWHHKGLEANKAEAYWHPSAEDRTQEKHDDRYQEYRRPNEDGDKNGKPKEDSQSRLINGWIKPNTVFEASLYVQNLQSEELGALLWLLTLNDEINDGDENHYFRLGYGKPLGFGSVTLEIDEERLANGCLSLGAGKDWKEEYYNAFDASPPAKLDIERRTRCIQVFEASMVAAYNPLPDDDTTNGDEKEVSNLTSFAQLGRVQSRFLNTPEARIQLEELHFVELPFISGFRRVLQGPATDGPIHYPRTDSKPNPEGKNFEWFTANERGRERDEDGRKLALPEVADEKGLPYNPTKPKQK